MCAYIFLYIYTKITCKIVSIFVFFLGEKFSIKKIFPIFFYESPFSPCATETFFYLCYPCFQRHRKLLGILTFKTRILYWFRGQYKAYICTCRRVKVWGVYPQTFTTTQASENLTWGSQIATVWTIWSP